MGKKARSMIIDRCGDEHGDLLKLGRKGSRYFLEKVAPAYTSRAGQVTRTYMKKKVAERKFLSGCEYRGL